MKTNGTLGLRSLWSAATLFLAAPGALFPAGYVNFNVPKAYAVGSQPNSAAVGDFNGDGKLDLAVANGGDNTVSILRGNGNGVFRNAVSYPAGQAPSSVAVGDFNGDGKLDLAVTNSYYNTVSTTVSILLGNGDRRYFHHRHRHNSVESGQHFTD